MTGEGARRATSRSRLSIVAAAAAMLLWGCSAHHANLGDRAAATGDWKTAEMQYRQALSRDPNNADLKTKHDQAKTEAVKQAKSRAQSCLQDRNFQCAQSEADYAVFVDESDQEAATLKRTVHKAYALDFVQKAGAMAATDPLQAFGTLDQARQLSNDPEVEAQARGVEGTAVKSAVDQSNQLRRNANAPGQDSVPMFDRAIAMLDRAARVDPRLAQNLNDARADKERWIQTEYERRARAGDDAVAHHDWKNAVAAYQSAEQLRPGGRAKNMVPYVNLLQNGDAAMQNHDFATARDSFVKAAQMPEDRNRFAAAEVEQVDHAIQAEYERLEGLGDQALQHHDWATASARFGEAEHLRPGGPAKGAMDYCAIMTQADALTAQKNWKAAADAYRQAANRPEDRDRYAASMIDKVEVKPRWIRIKTVLVKPVQPDGTPWVGRPSVALQNVLASLMTKEGHPNWHAIATVPPENVPTLVLEITMPDGKRFRSAPKQGVAAAFDVGVVAESNQFEDRMIGFKVLHAEPNATPAEIESADLAIKDLLGGHEPGAGQSILYLETATDDARGRAEDAVSGMTAIEPVAAANPTPTPVAATPTPTPTPVAATPTPAASPRPSATPPPRPTPTPVGHGHH